MGFGVTCPMCGASSNNEGVWLGFRGIKCLRCGAIWFLPDQDMPLGQPVYVESEIEQ